jgi:hypothetical protein
MPVTIVVCVCGKRLRASGLVPGRVGRCPACGAEFQVPEPTAAAAASPGPAAEEILPPRAPVGSSSAFVAAVGRDSGLASERSKPQRDGLIRLPRELETRLRDSLLYPLWGGTGVTLLLLMPLPLWLISLPTFSLIALLLEEGLSPSARFGLAFLSPVLALFALVLSYTLLYLGRVLVASALGEIHHPRWPSWDLNEMWRGVFRWFWALLVGVAIGVIPAVAYWISCGDLDLFDIIILVELLALGAVYAQMALLASILHDDPLGANPVTVIRGIVRMGWSYARTCLVSAVALALAIVAFAGVLAIKNPLLAALALWGFWVLVLYLAMVALRVLGLCYHRRSRALGWFRDRPRWGV